jgi:hypothetical protein
MSASFSAGGRQARAQSSRCCLTRALITEHARLFELAYGRRLENVEYRAVITKTVPADNREQEAIDLLAELTSSGLNPKIVLRWSPPAVREVTATTPMPT